MKNIAAMLQKLNGSIRDEDGDVDLMVSKQAEVREGTKEEKREACLLPWVAAIFNDEDGRATEHHRIKLEACGDTALEAMEALEAVCERALNRKH